MDDTVYTVTIPEDGYRTVYSEEEPAMGYLKINKEAENDTDLSLAGARYGVYTNWDAADENDWDYRVDTLETDSDGYDKTSLQSEVYYVKETEAPDGFELDDTIYRVEVEPGETSSVTSVEELTKGWAKVKKVPSENEHLVEACLQQYSLAGAEYSIYTSSSLSASTKVATLTTKSDGISNAAELPIGTY